MPEAAEVVIVVEGGEKKSQDHHDDEGTRIRGIDGDGREREKENNEKTAAATTTTTKPTTETIGTGILLSSSSSPPPSSSSSPITTPPTPATPEPPYSIYTKSEKWLVVSIVAVAGFFSPLPATIYFPIIPTLSLEVFHVSIEAMNQTVTAYLVMQGLSPMLWGPLSDRYGRRPVFLACLAVLTGSCVGLALCPTDAFWLLIVLRLLQSGGCASAIALGAGVVGDIGTPEERGGFFGLFNLGPMIGPCVGPAIGGALADRLGWRSIFWFLVIMASLCFMTIYCILPETLRHLVKNGSHPPPHRIHRPLIRVVGRHYPSSPPSPSPLPSPRNKPPKKSINPLPLLTYPDVLLTLLFTGLVYCVNYSIMATTSSALSHAYPDLSTTLLGIAYLPTGLGMILGTFFTGKLLDREYARAVARHEGKKKEEEEAGGGQVERGEEGREEETETRPFPKEYARLRLIPAQLVILAGATVGWGVCIGVKAHIAATLVLQGVLGWFGMAVLNSSTTMLIDILQSRSSAATACINLVRCSLGAIVVAVTDRMVTSRLGYIGSYSLLGGVTALCIPIVFAEMKFGSRIRIKRDKQQLEQERA